MQFTTCIIAHEFGGKSKFEITAGGITCRIEFPAAMQPASQEVENG